MKRLLYAYPLGGSLLLALLLRAAYALWLGPALLVGDAEAYVAAGLAWQEALPTDAYWPPGLPALLALVLGRGLPDWVAAAGLMLGLSAIFLALLGYLLRAEGVAPRRRAGLLLLMAVYPAMIHHGSAPLSHLPVAILLLGLYACLRVGSRGAAWGGGGLLGLAVLVRPASVALLAGAWLALGRRRWRQGLGILLGLGLVVLPWQVWLVQHTGHFVWINYANSRNLYLGNHAAAPDYRSWWLGSHEVCVEAGYESFCVEQDSLLALPLPARETAYRQLAGASIAADPGRFLRRVGHRFRVFWAFDTYAGGQLVQAGRPIGWLFLAADACCYGLLASMALVGLWQGGPGRGGWLVLAYLLPYLLAFSHPTYHLPVMGLLALWAGQARRPWPRHPLFYLAGAGWGLIQIEWLLRRLWF